MVNVCRFIAWQRVTFLDHSVYIYASTKHLNTHPFIYAYRWFKKRIIWFSSFLHTLFLQKQFSPTAKNFYAKFYVHVCWNLWAGKIQNFIQLSLNLTQLCHIKLDQLTQAVRRRTGWGPTLQNILIHPFIFAYRWFKKRIKTYFTNE